MQRFPAAASSSWWRCLPLPRVALPFFLPDSPFTCKKNDHHPYCLLPFLFVPSQVIFIGTVAIDPNCAQMLAGSEIIPQLMALIEAKQEDDELMLQICYAVYYLVHHTEVCARGGGGVIAWRSEKRGGGGWWVGAARVSGWKYFWVRFWCCM